MPTGSRLTNEQCREALDLHVKHGTHRKACEEIGLKHAAFGERIAEAKRRGLDQPGAVEMPTFPDDDIPISEIIDLQKKRFEKRQAYKDSKTWFPIKINIDGPIGLAFVGDPHVDDDGCNWPLLEKHIGIMRDTEGMFACNIGDATNNWVGRLIRLYAEQETSKKTGFKLAKWLMHDAGVPWLIWLLGNHDMWNDGVEVFRQMGGNAIEMEHRLFTGTTVEEWQAQFKLVFKNGKEVPIWAAHNFPGHSQWNTLHGPGKAAHMKEPCSLYVCGHTHNWATHQEESASRGFVYWLARARGYKFVDQFGELLGHASQQEGATILAVIDPDSKTMAGEVQCFADMEEGAEYLRFKRRNI